MNIKHRQLIALLAALCWIFAQNISLDHQFTSEHLSKNDSHICLTFANDEDEVLLSSPATLNFSKLATEELVCHHVSPPRIIQLSIRTRAPPSRLS